MAFLVDETTGNITCIQGDHGEIRVDGLETDKDYTLYLAIQNTKRQPVGSEISVEANRADSVIFYLTPALTNLLTVKPNEDSATYYYSIKACATGNYEDTLFISNSSFGDLNTITVYPKRVEGTVNS